MELLGEDTLRSILESTPAGLLLVDSGGRIFRVTRELERLSGWSRADLVGQSIETLVPMRFREGHTAKRSGYFASPIVRPMGSGLGLYLLRKDGSELPVDIGLSPVAVGGEPMVLAVVSEASPWQKAQQVAAEEERKAFLGLSQMASYVAHQVNTPLTNISLLASAIQRATGDHKLRTYAERIQEQRRAATDIVSRLMRIARIQNVSKADTDLRGLLDEAVEAVRPLVPSEVRVVRAYADEPVVIAVDRLQMKEAFVNLLKNAVEATREGTITVRLVSGNPAVQVIITDTGVGIPAEVLANLFTPFFTTKSETGTGLGLAYVKGVVTAHGGSVDVASQPGQGSTFTVALPAR